jgi:hypothetical protein
MLGDTFDNLLESVNTSIAERLFEVIHIYPTRKAVETEIVRVRQVLPKVRESIQRVRMLKLVAEDIDKLGMRLVGFETTPVDGAEVFVFDSIEHPAEDWGMKSRLVYEGGPGGKMVQDMSPDELMDYINWYERSMGQDGSPSNVDQAQANIDRAKAELKSKGFESKVEEADKTKVDRVDAEQTMKPQEEDTEVMVPDHMEDYSAEGEHEKGSKSVGTENELTELPDEKLDHEVTYESSEPLHLCNACFKTFRSIESKCTECESDNVERLVEEQKPSFDEESCQTIKFYQKARKENKSREEAVQFAAKGMDIPPAKVRNILMTQGVDQSEIPVEEEKGTVDLLKNTYHVKFTKDGKEQETRYMGFDEGDVCREMEKSPSVKVSSVVKVKESRKRKVQEASEHDLWDKVVDKAAGKDSKWDSVIDLMAQVWNGGFEQWIINGYAADEGLIAIHMLNMLETDAGGQVAELVSQALNSDFATGHEGFREEEYVKAAESLDELDTQFYAGLDDQLVQDLAKRFELVKEGKVAESTYYAILQDEDKLDLAIQAIQSAGANNVYANRVQGQIEIHFEIDPADWEDIGSVGDVLSSIRVDVPGVKIVRESLEANPSQARKGQLHETVEELVRETPGIVQEDQEILVWAIENGVILNTWPDTEEMIDQLSHKEAMHTTKVDVEGMDLFDPDGLDLGEIEAVYLKYVLLPEALEAYGRREASEKLTVDAMKAIQGPVLRFDYGTAANHEDIMKDLATTDWFTTRMVGSRITLVNARGIDMTFAKDEDQEWKEWSDKFGFMSEAKLVEFTEDQLDQVAQEMFGMNFQELPDYDHQDAAKEQAKVKFAKPSGRMYTKADIYTDNYGRSTESKVDEKDFSVAGKGIVDKTDAEDLARDKGGIVVPDDEDSEKFQVIVKDE